MKKKKKEKSQIGIYQANKPNEVISISTNSRCCICLLEFAIVVKVKNTKKFQQGKAMAANESSLRMWLIN